MSLISHSARPNSFPMICWAVALLGILCTCGAVVAPAQAARIANITAAQGLIGKARGQLNVSPETAISLAEKSVLLAQRGLNEPERDLLLSEADAVILSDSTLVLTKLCPASTACSIWRKRPVASRRSNRETARCRARRPIRSNSRR